MTTTVRPTPYLRILGVEVGEGLRAIQREPIALFFSVLMPVMFFWLFAPQFGNRPSTTGIPTAGILLATYGTFGVGSVMLMNPGIMTAEDRVSGWLRMKKVSGAPVGITIVAKALATLPYAVGVMVAITAVSLLVSGPSVDPLTWLRMVGTLLLGALPLALFSLAVGFVCPSNTAAAVLNAAFFPMVLASGLWFPLDMLPSWVSGLAPVLPLYHVAQLATAQLTGADATVHVVALLVTTVVGGAAAALAFRNLRV